MNRHIGVLLALQTGLIIVIGALAVLYGTQSVWSVSLWALSLTVFLAAYASLGKSLTMSPVPNRKGLRTGGIYRYVRHPMYLSLLIFGAGAAVMFLWTLIPLLLLAAVLYYKIELEERLLAKSYPDYHSYRASTKRLIPFVW